MSIVLNENEWARECIASCSLGKDTEETLRRVARFYLDAKYSKAETVRKLELFLLRCNPLTSLPKNAERIDRAVRKAAKCEAVCIDSISISKTEMERIDSLKSKQARRLAFTLLCLAKYWNIVSPNNDCWVNSEDSEIMAMANIRTSLRRQGLLYWTLKEAGLVRFSKKVDNTNVRVCFIDNEEPVLHITDFRNLGYQYLMYHGEPYFECMSCGIVVKSKNSDNKRRQKYCSDCAAKIRLRQNVESVMRCRRTNQSSKNVGN